MFKFGKILAEYILQSYPLTIIHMRQREVEISYVDSIEALAAVPLSKLEEFKKNLLEISSLIPDPKLLAAFKKKWANFLHYAEKSGPDDKNYIYLNVYYSIADGEPEREEDLSKAIVFASKETGYFYTIPLDLLKKFNEEINDIYQSMHHQDIYEEKVRRLHKNYNNITFPIDQELIELYID